MTKIEQERRKELGFSFVINLLASSHIGSVWERQIGILRSVLTSILDQSAGRLDSSSLGIYTCLRWFLIYFIYTLTDKETKIFFGLIPEKI